MHRRLRTYLVEDNKTIRENLIATLEDLAEIEPVGYATTETAATAWLANTSSYTAQTLEDTQTRSVLETLARVDPSVRLEYGDGASADALMVRGFPVANDELSLNGLPGITSQFRVSPEFVERAEVLKGPAVLLNGMSPGGAVGGAVNLVSKRAGDEPLTRINTGFSSDSLWAPTPTWAAALASISPGACA